MVHRDVKPENIIIEGGKPGGKVFLVDFGGIQQGEQDVADSEVTDTGTLVGTYGYMAPEQLRGSARPASDLFALGGTLLYLLTGQYQASHIHWPGVAVALPHADLDNWWIMLVLHLLCCMLLSIVLHRCCTCASAASCECAFRTGASQVLYLCRIVMSICLSPSCTPVDSVLLAMSASASCLHLQTAQIPPTMMQWSVAC